MTNTYCIELKNAISSNPTFKAICDFNINQFPVDGYTKYYGQLGHGTAILQTAEALNLYIAAYGDMHKYKLNEAFNALFKSENFNNKSIEVVDWGCGQALASCVLVDYIKEHKIGADVSKFILIEPSQIALQRGVEHIDAIYQRKPKPVFVKCLSKADDKLFLNKHQDSNKIKVHLFSNVIDIALMNLDILHENVLKGFSGVNYFVCVSPVNEFRLKTFYQKFPNSKLISSRNNNLIGQIFRPSSMQMVSKSISRIEYVFKVSL